MKIGAAIKQLRQLHIARWGHGEWTQAACASRARCAVAQSESKLITTITVNPWVFDGCVRLTITGYTRNLGGREVSTPELRRTAKIL